MWRWWLWWFSLCNGFLDISSFLITDSIYHLSSLFFLLSFYSFGCIRIIKNRAPTNAFVSPHLPFLILCFFLKTCFFFIFRSHLVFFFSFSIWVLSADTSCGCWKLQAEAGGKEEE